MLVAREGEIGFVAVYDDGHVAEFAAATAEELAGALVTDDSAIVYDEGPAAELVAAARTRVEAARPDPVNDARLVLVKLLIGVGRARRGERLAAGGFVRSWALECFVRALRARRPVAESARDAIDPLRRFERDYPELAARLDGLLAAPVEEAGRELFRVFRETLEPGWAEFPTAAADAVAARLGWDEL